MASQNPYEPPAPQVSREVPANRKVIKQLLTAWADGVKMLKNLRRLKFACYLTLFAASGYLTLVFADRLSLTKPALAIAVLGGMSFGFGGFVAQALSQWPTLKRYLDWERMQRDYDSGDDA